MTLKDDYNLTQTREQFKKVLYEGGWDNEKQFEETTGHNFRTLRGIYWTTWYNRMTKKETVVHPTDEEMQEAYKKASGK